MAMPADAVPEVMTADEFLSLEIPGKSTELVRGRLLIHEPPGMYHGEIAGKLAYLVGAVVYPRKLGRVFGQDTGFRIASQPDTVRAPDLAFVRSARLPDPLPLGYADLAPDLVVEISSPGDRRGELLAKVGEWLDAGVRLAWVINPDRRQAQVYRLDGSVSIVDSDGSLDGEDVLTGFRCGIAELLD